MYKITIAIKFEDGWSVDTYVTTFEKFWEFKSKFLTTYGGNGIIDVRLLEHVEIKNLSEANGANDTIITD